MKDRIEEMYSLLHDLKMEYYLMKECNFGIDEIHQLLYKLDLINDCLYDIDKLIDNIISTADEDIIIARCNILKNYIGGKDGEERK